MKSPTININIFIFLLLQTTYQIACAIIATYDVQHAIMGYNASISSAK